MRTRPTATDAFRLARRRWLAGERVDVSALAGELDVSRVTLYRWVGSRETLLGEIVSGLAEQTLGAVAREVRGRGAERVAAIVTRFMEVAIGKPRHADLARGRGRAGDAPAHPL